MYFSKKYWNTIMYIYKLNCVNITLLEKLNKDSNSYYPLIFKFIGFLIIYNGKQNNTYKITKTNFKINNFI